MIRSRLVVLSLVLLVPAAASAQNREHLQMNADLRQLQEHVSRLQLAVNQIDAQLDAADQRIESAAANSVKGFADQQLLINQLAGSVQTIRERLDDNTVRVSQLSQEFVAIREGLRLLTDQINTLVGLLQPSAAQNAPAGNAPATASAGDDSTAAPPLAPVIMPPSAGRTYQAAIGDFMSGRYDNAIAGFREVVEMYPNAPDAANSQFHIGESFYYKKECKNAVPEYQKFVDTYTTSDRRPDGLYMMGLCYSDLKQTANARRMFEQVLKEYPDSTSALQANQRLQALSAR